MFKAEFSFEALLASYLSAIGFDIVHALAMVFFFYVLSRTMLEKLDRVKHKFGLIEEKKQ